ncbi:MAG: OmpA family protein, partial [Bacteroidota bacterium]
VDLKNFYFVGNQPILLKRSESELPKLLKFMQYNKDIIIEIAGHVNRPNEGPVSTQTFSYRLSVDRAKTVYDYLLANGIAINRMKYKGYGNWKMRYPNATNTEQQAANRRVEIKVLSMD